MHRTRTSLIAGLAGLLLLGSAGTAFAMSDGVYHPRDQRCSPEAEDTARENTTEPGCQNASLYLKNGKWEIVRVGTQQTPEGTFVHQLEVDSDFDFSQVDPTKGLVLYFGADDNLDGGEHDGASGMGNGPSDGGGIRYVISPDAAQRWIAAASAGDTAYLQTHPIPLVSYGMGACADGICFNVTTERRVAYQGGGKGHRDAADYDGVKWDPESCGGPSGTVKDCDDPSTKKKEDIRDWNNRVGTVYAEPGVQVYEDPDPEGSPIGPYPLPGAYVGTCGAMVGGGGIDAPADMPATNSAGQIDLRQGCG